MTYSHGDFGGSAGATASAGSPRSGKQTNLSAHHFRERIPTSRQSGLSSDNASGGSSTELSGQSRGFWDASSDDKPLSVSGCRSDPVERATSCSALLPEEESFSESLAKWESGQRRKWIEILDPKPLSSSGSYGTSRDPQHSEARGPPRIASPTTRGASGCTVEEASPSEPRNVHPAWQSWLDHCNPGAGSPLSAVGQTSNSSCGTPAEELMPLPHAHHQGWDSPRQNQTSSASQGTAIDEPKQATGTTLGLDLARLLSEKASLSEQSEAFSQAETSPSASAGLEQSEEEWDGNYGVVHPAEPPGLSCGFTSDPERAAEEECALLEPRPGSAESNMRVRDHAWMQSPSASQPVTQGWDFGETPTPPSRDADSAEEWKYYRQGISGELSDEEDIAEPLDYDGAHILELSGLADHIQERHVQPWLLPFVEETMDGLVYPKLSYVPELILRQGTMHLTFWVFLYAAMIGGLRAHPVVPWADLFCFTKFLGVTHLWLHSNIEPQSAQITASASPCEVAFYLVWFWAAPNKQWRVIDLSQLHKSSVHENRV
jgi:hypothetical protein